VYELNHNGTSTSYLITPPRQVRIFYSQVQMFYFNSNTARQIVHLLRAALFFLKLILTGCCLVTRNVKAISTDLEHGLKSVVKAYCINKTLLLLCA